MVQVVLALVLYSNQPVQKNICLFLILMAATKTKVENNIADKHVIYFFIDTLCILTKYSVFLNLFINIIIILYFISCFWLKISQNNGHKSTSFNNLSFTFIYTWIQHGYQTITKNSWFEWNRAGNKIFTHFKLFYLCYITINISPICN